MRKKVRIIPRFQVWTVGWMEVQSTEIRSETKESGSGRKMQSECVLKCVEFEVCVPYVCLFLVCAVSIS